MESPPERFQLVCLRCDYKWFSKTGNPAVCANKKCNSPYWNRPRKHPKREE